VPGVGWVPDPRDAASALATDLHKSALSAKYGTFRRAAFQRSLDAVLEHVTFIVPRFSLKGGRVVTDLSGDEMVALFDQHLTFLREVRDAVWANIAAGREMIGRSLLIVQIDEQISRMERELGLFGSHARRGPEPETLL
jgi:hypothetical protein